LVKNNFPDYEIPLTPKLVAIYCHVTKSTALKWIKNGKLQAFRLPSGHYRIDKSDFKQFLETYNMPIKEWLFESESDNKRLKGAGLVGTNAASIGGRADNKTH
jgi:excisionase family DNA binding protein